MSTPPSSGSDARPPEGDAPLILIVDDYAETRRLLYFYLRNEYRVVTVESAEEALNFLHAHGADLVVMDINLQDGMNGIAATEVIRADKDLQHLPVLAMSAYAYPDDRARFLKAGFDDYIAKPIFRERMLRTARALLKGERAAGEPGVWISKKDDGAD